MGNTNTKEPPKVVLVPPLFERSYRGRSRFTKSAYDLNFCKQRLHWLFTDYVLPGPRLWLLLSPPEDERVSISARLGSSYVPPLLFGAKPSANDASPWETSRASLALRFQPDPTNPLSFVDVQTAVHGAGSSAARMRACLFDPNRNMSVFAAASNTTSGPAGMAPVLGARYSSPQLSVGGTVQPSQGFVDVLWLVTRSGPLTFGVQYDAKGTPLLGRSLFDKPVSVATEALSKVSYALAYSPAGVTAYGRGNFSAAVEVIQQRQLCLSYLHHLALQRRVYNPLERGDVVAITNYLDMGLQMAIPLDASADRDGFMRMAAAWQVNKNVLVKAKLGTDALSLGLALKSWTVPAVTVAASVGWDVVQHKPVVGLQVHTDNIGALRYERAPPGTRQVGKRLVQRHVASQDDIDAAQGVGRMVPLEAQADAVVLGQVDEDASAFL